MRPIINRLAVSRMRMICPDCGERLISIEWGEAILHPTHFPYWIIPDVLNTCQYAGKRFKRPTIELEELK